jgi:26S proteasome regulatory subunit T6
MATTAAAAPAIPYSSLLLRPASASSSSSGTSENSGLRGFFERKVDELETRLAEKAQSLQRLQAQRNELNATVRALRDELTLLQEPGSHVGEVAKVLSKTKVLVKVGPEGKYVVDIEHGKLSALISPSTTAAAGAAAGSPDNSFVKYLLFPSFFLQKI